MYEIYLGVHRFYINMNRNQQNQGMWNPYGVQGFQFLPPEDGDRTGEMPSSVPLMNPLLSPMMVRGSAPYTQFSINGPYGPVQFQGFPVGGQNPLNVNDMNQLSEMNPDMNPEMMNMIQWGQQQGLQPIIYPMMMMVPLNQAQMNQQFPDVVEDGAQDEFLDAVSDFPYDTRSDHDVTPDLVRATTETEPTYMNEENQQTTEQEQPSYANDPGIVEVTSSGVQSHKPVSTVHQASSLRRGATSVHNFGEEEPRIRNQMRAQSVQPGHKSKEYDLASRKEKFKTYSYNRSKQANRSYTLSRTQSTVSNFQPSERPPTVLHIPDIKPRLRKDEDHSSTQSLFPAVITSNLRKADTY
ncbi:uncharacterized protein LOC111717635 [Eurytemora carolleeae]|uniref:uncharacterized protein LOC111717635 n=1 Tax=Eurytemora carolleeae TaxID=1294199 RepID=UPI000C777E9E|nr:uncharacterized protein LOC111717635 [Eurytemora carolleeae]|eukprot:XP_023348898.1 uncharacterized protein LOC111717635 [Eurytemora affinis]